ncbi:MAG TPA: type IX secretion system sortase PorU [Bacteroidales bacterium]
MRYLYFILFLAFPLFFFGQQTISAKLDWSEMQSQKTITSLQVNYFSFPGAENTIEYGSLPVYSATINLPDELFGCEIEIKEIVSDTLSPEASELLTDSELLSDKFSYHIIYQEKKANIHVVPLRRSDEIDQIIRLVEFEIRIIFVPVEEQTPTVLSMARTYKNNSVLSSGNWYKMGIVETGVHKIGYNNLVEMGLNPAQIDISKIGIFGNYNGMLPEENSKPRIDDLEENAIQFVGGEDGKWNENDYLIFFARSAVSWKYNPFTGRFDHKNNSYSDTTFYFFTPDQGSNFTIENVGSTTVTPTQQMTSFVDFAVHDKDIENLIYSGREWYGERLTSDTVERTFVFNFPNLDSKESVYLNFEMVARSGNISYYGLDVNGELVLDSMKIDRLPVNSAYYAKSTNKKTTFFADDDQLNVRVKCLTSDATLLSWINFIELNVRRELIYSGGQMTFRDPHVSAAGNVTEFKIGGANENLKVWNVSNIHKPENIQFQILDENLRYRLPTDSLLEFVVFDNNSFFQPVSFSTVVNQNLHNISSLNMVIISPTEFLGQAERLAKIHQNDDGLVSVVVTPEMIYNEFSSGTQDVTAIRDFMKMLRDKGAFGDDHAYLLLFGDASFDYKHRIHGNTNLVPTYESLESLKETGSFVTDDFFGLLDDNEGSNSVGNLDIGIGRLPVTTVKEATVAVDKIEHYMSRNEDVMGNWRNNICFVADDMDANLHLDQANSMIDIVDTLHPGFHINKIFSDAYQKIKVPNGKRFPEVNTQIKKQVDQGALILNYTGHGGLIGWSEEVILDVPTIRSFENLDNMPLFITATCEFSRYDNPEFVSAGELLFLNEKGGGIALMTTTRLAYAHANIVVNRRIYNNLMTTDKGKTPRLGDLVRVSKIPSNTNYLNFVLLGDPAMHLAFPQNEVVTNVVNSKAVNGTADTVHALSEVHVSGFIQDVSGNKLTDFNGFVYPKVYDKPSKYKTLGNDPRSFKVDFYLSDKVLFEGKITVLKGEFSFSFLVPKDIAYEYGFGEINYYAVDTTSFADAWGAYEQIFIGGVDESAEIDNIGPDIQLYIDNKNFQNRQTTTGHPLLLADLHDEYGISYTGQSLGRDMVMVLDNNYSSSEIVNDFFSLDIDTYKSGSLAYQFEKLEKGWHTITLKAWDLQNNSSEKTIEFYVDDQANIQLAEVVNYPNPFVSETNFGFIHNKNNSNLNVQIKIYDMNGRYVGELSKTLGSEGNKIAPLTWDGRNQYGSEVSPGVYTYNIIVTDYYGNQSIQRQKMIKLSE